MKMTNKYNLPPALVNAAAAYEPKPGRIGVTTLIDAPLPGFLRRQHWDEVVEDVLDRLWALRSQGMHKTLEFHAPPFTWPELKLECPIGNINPCRRGPTCIPARATLGRLQGQERLVVCVGQQARHRTATQLPGPTGPLAWLAGAAVERMLLPAGLAEEQGGRGQLPRPAMLGYGCCPVANPTSYQLHRRADSHPRQPRPAGMYARKNAGNGPRPTP